LVAAVLLALAFLMGACDIFLEYPTPTVFSDSPADWYTIYFTDPSSPLAENYRGGPDEALAAAIDQARLSVDVAVYDLNLWSLRDALVAAHRRGVTVRVVTESDNLDEPEIQDLTDAGVEVLGDRREGLMHHKFVIIDRLEVWSGSMNFTTSCAYLNDNNLVRIRSVRLAEDYTTEFEEMFVDDLFGPDDRPDTPYPTLTVEGTILEVYFSPDDGAASRLVDLINGAQESIYFMAYSFTSDEIAAAMLARADAGITVAGVFEESQYRSNVGTEYDNLRLAGLDVRLDGNLRNMHHKVIIIDGQIVVTGSYNFSASAEDRNDENLLVIHNAQIAALYKIEFDRVFTMAQE